MILQEAEAPADVESLGGGPDFPENEKLSATGEQSALGSAPVAKDIIVSCSKSFRSKSTDGQDSRRDREVRASERQRMLDRDIRPCTGNHKTVVRLYILEASIQCRVS
jgi:hypothetical protein